MLQKILILCIFVLLLTLGAVFLWTSQNTSPTSENFIPPQETTQADIITFPEDAGHHKESVDWWYLNSHLKEKETGKQYAYSKT